MINNSFSLNPEIFQEISNKAIANKRISWGFIERICSTFDDVLEIVIYSISVGALFTGIPSEKTEKFLISHNINLRNLQ